MTSTRSVTSSIRRPRGVIDVQLDQTQIVIRARSLGEIGDLAMMVAHRFPGPTIFAGLLGAFPWALVNLLLIGWIPVTEFSDSLAGDSNLNFSRYAYLMFVLVVLQAPIAGALSTVWLGRAVFEPNVKLRDALDALRSTWWPAFWSLGVIRGPIPLMAILATGWGQPFSFLRDLFAPTMLLAWACVLRSRWPFVPEILLLERCPLRSTDPSVIPLKRRRWALHDLLQGELSGRFLVVSLVLCAIALSIHYALGWSRGVISGYWGSSLIVELFLLPLAMWLAASFSVVVRFLSYLDTRIRLEGWEVDLAVRAEANRMQAADANRIPGAVMALLIAVTVATTATAATSAPIRTTTSATPVKTPEVTTKEPIATLENEGPKVVRPQGANWIDDDTGTLRPIRVRPSRRDVANRSSDWEGQPPAPRTLTPPSMSPVKRVLSWAILIIGLSILAICLLFLYRRIEPLMFREGLDDFEARPGGGSVLIERIMQLPSEIVAKSTDLRAEAERLMQAERWEEAIAALYGHQLMLLDRRGWLRLHRGKTNRRYLEETHGHSSKAHAILDETVWAFEASYFGRRTTRPEQVMDLWAKNQELESVVQGDGEVTR